MILSLLTSNPDISRSTHIILSVAIVILAGQVNLKNRKTGMKKPTSQREGEGGRE